MPTPVQPSSGNLAAIVSKQLITPPTQEVSASSPLEWPKEGLHSPLRSAKRRTSRNPANDLAKVSFSTFCALPACVASSILQMVLETDPHLVLWMTSVPLLECLRDEGRKRAALDRYGFCTFWNEILEQVKERSIKVNAFSENRIKACLKKRISAKIRVLTIIDNCECKKPCGDPMTECGKLELTELKILVVKPNVDRRERERGEYLGTDEWDRNNLVADAPMSYTRTMQSDELGAAMFLLQLNKVSTGASLEIEHVTVSTVIMRENVDSSRVYWHNTFVPHGDIISSWEVASYMTRILSHFSMQSNLILSGLENVTLQTVVLLVKDNMRLSRSSGWERKVGAGCQRLFGSGQTSAYIDTTTHLMESLFDQTALLNIGSGPPGFLMGMPCGLAPDDDETGGGNGSIQLGLGKGANNVGLRANIQRALLHRRKGAFVFEELEAAPVTEVPIVVCTSQTHSNRDLSMANGAGARPGCMPLVHDKAACFGWENCKGEKMVYDVFLY
jgi:hypothetical protein